MGDASCRIVVTGKLRGVISGVALLLLLPVSVVFAENSPLIHNSQTINSQKYGTWGADYTCATCHVKGFSPNIKKISPLVRTPTGYRPVRFDRITASSNDTPGVFGNDERTYDVDASRNICEVCHHRTIYHTYSASLLSSRQHTEHKSNNRDCNTCHKHRYGYRPPDTRECVDCHATPPTSPDGMVSNAFGPTPPPTAGAHDRHRNVEGMECHTCHNNYGHGYQGNDVIEMGFRIDRRTWSGFSGISSVMGGTVTATNNPLFNNRYAVAPGNPGTHLILTNDWDLTCSVYCHGDGWGVPSGKQGGAISWIQGPLGSCDSSSCHGTTPTNPPNPGLPGAHTRHVGDLAMACTKCHDDYPNPHMVNGRVKWNLSGQGENATYKGFRIHSTSHLPGVESYGSCKNIYCHSSVQPEGGNGTPPVYREVVWGDSTTIGCSGCHDGRVGDPTVIATGSHTTHLSAGYACGECHRGGGADGPLMTHLDENIQVVFGSFSGLYSQMPLNRPGDGYGNCSSNYCHSDGRGVARTVQWGANGTVGCTSCHKGGGSDPVASGKHLQHLTSAPLFGSNLGCRDCHGATVSDDQTLLSDRSRHLNRFGDYTGLKAGKYVAGGCTSYCHTDGKGGAPGVAVGWNDGSRIDDCRGCHGNSAPPAFTSVAGEPNYPNAAEPGSLRSNSHLTHTTRLSWAGAASCDLCHRDTVVPGGGAIASSGRHLDRSIDVSFDTSRAGNGSYDPLSRTCSNTLCHGSLTPRWGDSAGGGCPTCHPSLSGVHTRHIGDLMTSGVVTFYGYTANRSSGTVYRFGCATCHPVTETGKHRNGVVDLDLSSTSPGTGKLRSLNSQITLPGTGYTKSAPDSLSCTLVYCHSDGRSSSAPVYRPSPNWYGSFSGNRCGMCHDNPPQYAGQSHHVAQSSLGDNGHPPYREAGHMVGIHFRFISKGGTKSGFLGFSSSGNVAHGNPTLSTTVSCSICHSGIVSATKIDTYAMDGTPSLYRCGGCHTPSTRTPLQSGEIVDTSRHLNGEKEVVFAPVEFRTKAQLSNVANALGWSRTGDYKSDSSYDSFNLALSTWDPQSRSCLTACHVNQPGITWGGAIQCSSCHANQ